MGGKGLGHKSVRAIQSRLENIQKARAARRRAPLPWRSGLESRIIEQLVWQWWVLEVGGRKLEVGRRQQQIPIGSDELRVTLRSSGQASGERKQEQVPHRHPAKAAGWVRDDNFDGWQTGAASSAPTKANRPATAGKPWAKYRVARFLGVSHTWVNKLVKRFEADPDRMRRKMAAFAPASFEKLERAREETRRQRERGWLREPIRWRRVKVTLGGKKTTVVAVTRAEKRRRDALRQARGEMQRDAASRPQRQASAMPVRYAELPAWASGLTLAGSAGRKVRPVPFAFRRRRG